MSGRTPADSAGNYASTSGGTCWLVRALVALDRATELAATPDDSLPAEVRAHLWDAAAAYQRAVDALG